MNLTNLQTDFQNILLETKCESADWVANHNQSLTSRQRLAIYHNAYRIRLIDTLYDTFEHTATYLGSKWFEELAVNYVQTNVSTHTNIGYYGKSFVNHLAIQLPYDQEVAELAHMDWALRRAFDGRNSPVLTQDKLQKLISAGAEFDCLSPIATLSVSQQSFNTLDIWHAINQETAPPKVEQLAESMSLLIWRKGHSPHFRSLSKVEARAISLLCLGYGFETIGEQLNQEFPDANIVQELGTIIAQWLNDQLLTPPN